MLPRKQDMPRHLATLVMPNIKVHLVAKTNTVSTEYIRIFMVLRKYFKKEYQLLKANKVEQVSKCLYDVLPESQSAYLTYFESDPTEITKAKMYIMLLGE